MVNIDTLRAQVNVADNNSRLRLDSNQQVELMTGSFFGRQVMRLSSGTLTASRTAENQAIRDAVVSTFRGHYGDSIADATNPLTNSDRPLTAQMVKEWIRAAETIQNISQQLTSIQNTAQNPQAAQQNFDLKMELVTYLSDIYSDTAVNKALAVVDMSPSKAWTALDTQRLLDTAKSLHQQQQPLAASATSSQTAPIVIPPEVRSADSQLSNLKADIQAGRPIGQSLQDICNQCTTPEGQHIAHTVLDHLTPKELDAVLAQASAQQITTLANLPNARPDFSAALQNRYQADTQRFHTTVQRLQAENLNLPTSLTNAPKFADTVVQLAEIWGALQVYASHPSAPISQQTRGELQFLQGYIQTQTQPDTLAADDLSARQLGKLNQALRILVPRVQRATALQGFSVVFAHEFASRITSAAQPTQSTWEKLLRSAPNTTAKEAVEVLKILNQQRERAIDLAQAMLMDGGHNHSEVLAILQAPLDQALSNLPPQDALALTSSWFSDDFVNSLQALVPDLELSENEEALLQHCINSVPEWIKSCLKACETSLAPTQTTLPQQVQQVFDGMVNRTLTNGELSAVRDVKVQKSDGSSMDIQIPASFMKDANRAFAQIRIQGQDIFDFSGWSTLSDTQKTQRVEAGIQNMLSLCGNDQNAVQSVCHFLHQSALAPLSNTLALTDPPFLSTSSGIGVKAIQEANRSVVFDLTQTATGFNVHCSAQFELLSISTEVGQAPLALSNAGNQLNFDYDFSVNTAANRVTAGTSAPQLTAQLHLENISNYPMPVSSAIANGSPGTLGAPLGLMSPAQLGNPLLIDDMIALEAHSSASPHLSLMCSAWLDRAQNKPHDLELLIRLFNDPEIQTQLAQNPAFAGIGNALAEALRPLYEQSNQTLQTAFQKGSPLVQLGGNFETSKDYQTFIQSPPTPEELQAFRDWAKGPKGSPEGLAFAEAYEAFDSARTPENALALFNKFKMERSFSPFETSLRSDQIAINVGDQTYNNAYKAVFDLLMPLIDAALGPALDKEVLPALYALHQPS